MRGVRSLSTKLNLLLAFPLLALVVVAGLAVRRASDEAVRARATRDQADLSLAAATAARELALEADLSVSSASESNRALRDQRESTDETVDVLRSLIERDRDTTELRTGLALDGLSKLDSTREAIDGDSEATPDVLGAFSKITDSVLGLDRVMETTSDPRIVSPLTAHIALTRVIQDSARERGLIARMLTAGTVDPGSYESAVELAARQQLWFTQFENAASAEDLRNYNEAQAEPTVATVDRLRHAALAAGPGGPAEGSPNVWGRAVGERIELLESLADDTAERLVDATDAQVTATERGRSVAMTWLVVSLVVGAVLMLGLQRLNPPPRLAPVAGPADGPPPPDRQPVSGADDRSSVFLSFGRRTEALVRSQLQHIDALEAGTDNPDTLSDLFVLDHLATRLRRNAESLVVLAGAESPRRWTRPVSVVNVVRAAVAETADYSRVILEPMAPATIVGTAANDMSHLLAELVDNALDHSPGDTPVAVDGHLRGDGCYLVVITDAGDGMTDTELADANERLTQSPGADLSDHRYFGLYVVGQLARRHGIQVRLLAARHGGVTAEVLCPAELVEPLPTGQATVFSP